MAQPQIKSRKSRILSLGFWLVMFIGPVCFSDLWVCDWLSIKFTNCTLPWPEVDRVIILREFSIDVTRRSICSPLGTLKIRCKGYVTGHDRPDRFANLISDLGEVFIPNDVELEMVKFLSQPVSHYIHCTADELQIVSNVIHDKLRLLQQAQTWAENRRTLER